MTPNLSLIHTPDDTVDFARSLSAAGASLRSMGVPPMIAVIRDFEVAQGRFARAARRNSFRRAGYRNHGRDAHATFKSRGESETGFV